MEQLNTLNSVSPPIYTKSKIFVIFVALFFLIVGLIIGLSFKKSSPNVPTTKMVISSPTRIPSLSASEWTTYTDKAYNRYSFQLPSTWQAKDNGEGCGPTYNPPDNINIWATICLPYYNESVETVVERRINALSDSEKLIGKSAITLNGKQGIKLTIETARSMEIAIFLDNVVAQDPVDSVHSENTVLAAFLFVNDLNKKSEVVPVFNSMIESLRFKIKQATDLKKYKDRNYEFVYPKDWTIITNEDHLTIYNKKVSSHSEKDLVMMIFSSNSIEDFSFDDPVGTKKEIGINVFATKESVTTVDTFPAMNFVQTVGQNAETGAKPQLKTIVKINNDKYIYIIVNYPFAGETEQPKKAYEEILATLKLGK